MTSRLYEIIAPIASIASLTALALLPLLFIHITELDQKLVRQREETRFYERFFVHCMNGKTLLVSRTDAVDCVKL